MENDSEVKKRTYIENKMTEALIRQCWECNKPIVKQGGCNRMTCVCEAMMCYLCRVPVKDKNYDHFYGQGGEPTATKTCPLFTDEAKLHEKAVAESAMEAKKAMDSQNPEVKLKYDPTSRIQRPDVSAAAAAVANPWGEYLGESDDDSDDEYQYQWPYQ